MTDNDDSPKVTIMNFPLSSYTLAFIVFTCALALTKIVTTIYISYYNRAQPLSDLSDTIINIEYQPIVDLHSNQWVGCEALLRLTFLGKKINPQVVFLATAAFGLNRFLTRMICKRVAEDYHKTIRSCENIYISINLTLEDLKDREFPVFVHSLFKRHGLAPEHVTFEITEKYKLPYDYVLPQIIELRGMGFRIALDDFGIGYSGLESFERLPIDIVKLDRSFFSCSGKKFNPVWKEIFKISCKMKICFIAEGIEYPIEHRNIASQNVRFAQGWFYSKSMSAREFTNAFLIQNTTLNSHAKY